jgi:hypothetical protein
MFKLSILAGGLVLASACMASAQVTTVTTAPAPYGAPGSMRVSQLIGSNVNLQGANNFGKVEDVVLAQNGAPAYMVVSNGGRYAMFPWHAANINYGQRAVTYSVAPQAVQPLFFEQNAWPNSADTQYHTRVMQVFPNGAVAPPVGAENVRIKEKPNGTIKERIR